MTILNMEPIDDLTPSDEKPNASGKRRGRPPGAKTGTAQPRRSAAEKRDVDTALATMENLYSAASAGLMLSGRIGTASILADSIGKTQAANKQAFEASPRLAAAVARIGSVSAVGTFLAANITLAGTVAMALMQENAQIKQVRQAEAEQAAQQQGGF